MCDILVSLPHKTEKGNLIFAKNSDREPEEAQEILHIPRKQHQEQQLICTYISIPQAQETYEIILSKPFQMWGAEMGLNEFGLAIGNEAVFTRVKMKKNNSGLTGMDLLRLALERSKNAQGAIDTITGLLELYGQDACGGYKNKSFYYHNSFIISDPNEAYILETAGKSWALKKVEEIGSISNALTIGNDYDQIKISNDPLIFPFQFFPKPKPFSFRDHFSDFLYTKVGKAQIRQACSWQLMEKTSKLNAEKMMDILRTHELPDPEFNPHKTTAASICMHATGLTNPSSTTGSMVAEIRKINPSTIWLTGTSMPCLSVYIPFFIGTNTLENFSKPSNIPDQSLWWKAEKVHRWICKDYQVRKKQLQADFQTLQQSFIEKEKALFSSNTHRKALEAFSSECLQQVQSLYDNYLKQIPF